MSDNNVIIDIVEKCYKVFYIKLSGQELFEFNPSDREKKSLTNFIILLDKKYGIESVSTNIIFDYFTFQLDYWANLDSRFGKKIPLNWYIGKKAFNRFLNRTEKDLWHAKRTLKKYNININQVQEKKIKDFKALKIRVYEETEKKRFFNTDRGFLNCIESTTLFNHRSLECISCKNKIECKKILKENFTKLYILRGYLRDEKN